MDKDKDKDKKGGEQVSSNFGHGISQQLDHDNVNELAAMLQVRTIVGAFEMCSFSILGPASAGLCAKCYDEPPVNGNTI